MSETRQLGNWTARHVVDAIRELQAAGQRVSLRSVGLYKRPTIDPIVSKAVGTPATRKLLYEMACNHFGSWDAALAVANSGAKKVAVNRFWSREAVVLSIQALQESGHPLNVGNIWRDRSTKTTETLFDSIGKKTTGAGLHDAARRYFGSWDNALVASGIPVSTVKEKTFWTQEKIIQSIQALHEHKIPLNSASVDKIENEKAVRVIADRIGKARHTKSLFGAAHRTFGSWDRALETANLEPSEIRKYRPHWNRISISKALRVLHRSGVSINAGSISKDKSDRTKEIILTRVGRRMSGQRIYSLSLRKFGSWDEALKYSGFYTSTIRRRGTRCERNRERIIEILRALSFHEFKLNSSAVMRNSRKMRLFNEVDFGRDLSGYSLKIAAKELFTDWEKALWEAGMNPAEICLRSSSYKSSLPLMNVQVEVEKFGRDEWRKAGFLGEAPRSPDQILEDRETGGSLQSAMESFGEEDQALLDEIFDEVLRVHHYKDQADLTSHISQRLQGSVSVEKIRSLFGQLSEQLIRH